MEGNGSFRRQLAGVGGYLGKTVCQHEGAKPGRAAATEFLNSWPAGIVIPDNPGRNEFCPAERVSKGRGGDRGLAGRSSCGETSTGLDQSAGEKQKVDHRRNRVSRKADHRCAADAPRKDRLAGLDGKAETAHSTAGGTDGSRDVVGVAAGNAPGAQNYVCVFSCLGKNRG